MPEEIVNAIDLRERATKIEIKFDHELFRRPVRKITVTGTPHKTVDGAIRDVGLLVLYDDGTTDTFYASLSARRPDGVEDPNLA